jgi:hypothetical protein
MFTQLIWLVSKLIKIIIIKIKKYLESLMYEVVQK